MVLIVITGPPGAGKSTLARTLESSFGVSRVRPLTSRQRRITEVHPNNDYVHLERREVAEAIRRNEVAFSDEVAGELYGVRLSDVMEGDGLRSLILPAARIPDIRRLARSVPFFLNPVGGETELLRRLTARGETEKSIAARMAWGRDDAACLQPQGVWKLELGSPLELAEEVIRVVELEGFL